MESDKRTDYISQAWNTYKDTVKSPITHAAILGGGAYLLSRLGWNPIVETVRSIGRYPLRALGGMTDEEYDMAMDELKNNSSYRKWIPGIFAALAAAGAGWASFDPDKEGYGLVKWDSPRKLPVTSGSDSTYDKSRFGWLYPRRASGQSKTSSFSYSYDGPMDDVDYYKAINSRDAISLFTNDPFLQNKQYARNMGTSIIADAAIRTGNNTPTLGNVFDSAVNKIENKLSFEGLASVGIKTVVANGAARLFTNAVGSMVGLPKSTQNKLIDAGTWAGAITAIFD